MFLCGYCRFAPGTYKPRTSPDYFQFTESILFIGMIIIGGIGTTIGPIFGVIFIRLLDVFVTKLLSPALQSSFPNLPPGFTSGIAPLLFGTRHHFVFTV